LSKIINSFSAVLISDLIFFALNRCNLKKRNLILLR
jgi:hypothetical protein